MEAAAANGQPDGKGSSGPAWLAPARFVVTVLLLLAFAVFIVYLLAHTDATNKSWNRYVYLLTGLEAIVFAAVGWLFGREVSRPVVEQAKEAGQAKEAAATEREKGASLARAVMAHDAAQPQRESRLQSMGAPQQAAAAQDMSALVELVKAQYPGV
jgi:signal transduction histidine kinase